MTGRWLTVSKTITRIYDATGRLLTCRQVLELGKRDGARGLIVESSHEHTRVLERSVADHLEWLASKPSVRGGPALDVTTEDQYRREQGT
ncbi:hypothetical protein [Nonomuraea turkmeniaca]|uniref:hypothetical protein n=1 Tax=Nonomuraea turkmeniaca TaxID=103838 RepID=UPI001B884694|nr:hypothetical protein [Nonomuraea turkmeniaca]